MNGKAVQTLIHVLALLAGVCSLLAVALTSPPFNLPPIVAGAFALAATLCTYVANQAPALGNVPPAPPAPPHG